MKRAVAVLISICMLLTGCSSKAVVEKPAVGTIAGSPENMKEATSKDIIAAEDTQSEVTELVAAKEVTIQEIEAETTKEEKGLSEESTEAVKSAQYQIAQEETPDFEGLDDEGLRRYLEDTVYANLISELNSADYFVENVSTVYISKEYLEELDYNSKENIFFGYTLSELDEEFQGDRFVFTLGDDGQTTVTRVESFDDTYEKALKNVAIGSGVILVCVTVSAATAGLGAPAVSMIFAVSAKSGAVAALSGGVIGGVSAGVIEGIKTQNFDSAVKAAALAGSEGFKWGAIGGAVSGGVGEAVALKGATVNGLTMNEAALIQKDTGYPLDVIKQLHSMDEVKVYQNAGLKPAMVNGKTALVRTDIDLNRVDEFGRTNLQRMQKGLAPLDSSGKSFQLHHIGQKNDATLAILTEAEHDAAALHGFVENSEITREVFNNVTRPEFWKTMATLIK